MSRPTFAILSTKNLLHNLSVIKNLIKPAKIIAMVKANAYGHGIRSVALRLNEQVDLFGVASIDEALALRKVGIKTPILLMQGVFEPNELLIASTERFHVVFHNKEQIEFLKKSYLPIPLQAWIKVNTGMGRLGFNSEEVDFFYKELLKCQTESVKILSHFSCSEDLKSPFNKKQINLFEQLAKHINTEYSLCNSGGIFHFPDTYYHYVRPGISLYGVSPIKDKIGADLNLKPVMTLQTSITAVKMLKKGDYIGYGARYRCPEDMPIGIVAFGYGDGYPITAKDGTPVLVNNTLCSLVGRVSMDMMTVDLRACPSTQVGDPVILWGDQLPIERVATYTMTIPWEMLTSIQHRVKFLWTQD